jgi:hypothetical protein
MGARLVREAISDALMTVCWSFRLARRFGNNDAANVAQAHCRQISSAPRDLSAMVLSMPCALVGTGIDVHRNHASVSSMTI